MNRRSFIILAVVFGLALFSVPVLADDREGPVALCVVEGLDITPQVARPGDTVKIQVRLYKTGSPELTYPISLAINGQVVEQLEFWFMQAYWCGCGDLHGIGSEQVTFSVKEDKVGTYMVDVNGTLGSFTVSENAPPPTASTTPASVSEKPAATTVHTPLTATPAPADKSNNVLLWGIGAGIVLPVMVLVFILRLRNKETGQ